MKHKPVIGKGQQIRMHQFVKHLEDTNPSFDKNKKVWMCEVNTDPGMGYPDELVLGQPNPDYKKELQACTESLHDMFNLLGLDAEKKQPASHDSLKRWFKLDFPETN